MVVGLGGGTGPDVGEGMGLTPTVAATLDAAVDLVGRVVAEHRPAADHDPATKG